MQLNRIDLNLFVVFDTIYAERNLTRAAAVLNVTQPAVSNALARLRDSFEDRLFVKVGRTMQPTPVAQNLIGPVRAALRQLQASVETRQSFDPATAERQFNLAIRDITCSLLLPRLMEALRQQAPHVRLHCHEVDRGDLVAELAAGTLDCAIDIPQLDRARLNSRPLLSDRYVCVLRRDHPAARRALDLDGFLALGQIMVSSRRRGRGYIELALARLGRQAEVALRLQHYQPAFHVAMSSDLALTAPASLARHYDVAVHELPFAVPMLESLLYWHKNADLEPANVWLRDLIAAAA
jgi:DNA-binding transcriptional LysR family regulator